MKIKANDYEAKEIMKIIREWAELTQEEFGESLHRSKHTIQAYEQGQNNYSMATFLEIAKTHGLTITIEKKTRK